MQAKSIFHYRLPCPDGLDGCPYIVGDGASIAAANTYLEFQYTGSRTKDIINQAVTVLAADQTPSIAVSSCTQYAHAMFHLINWLATQGLTPFCYSETDLARFKSDMEEGRWSEEDGRKLKGDIVRTRLLQAIKFGEWSVAKGYRNSFQVRRRAGRGLLGTSAYTILGSHVDRTLKSIPPDDKKEILLVQFYQPAYYLAALLMLYAGLRIDEVINIKVDDVPLASLATDAEFFILEVVGKGRKERPVVIGRDILEQMSDYFRGARADSQATCHDRYGASERYRRATGYFLLNHFDGQPISDHSTREAVKAAGAAAGLKDVTPHILRHWYATSRLRQKYSELEQKYGPERGIPEEAIIFALEDEITAIREDLGHVLSKTTMIYLRSFLKMMANRMAVKAQQQSMDRLRALRAARLSSPEYFEAV
jgi:integrase